MSFMPARGPCSAISTHAKENWLCPSKPQVSSRRWIVSPSQSCPEGPEWTYEIKLDGYRLRSCAGAGKTTLYSRRQNVLNRKFHYIATALKGLPDGTVIDGELVALGPDGRPDFNLLQNFRSAESRIIYYAFDILIHKNRDLTKLPLSERRAILGTVIEPSEHVALSQVSDLPAAEMLQFAKNHGLEGVVAKRSAASISLVSGQVCGASIE